MPTDKDLISVQQARDLVTAAHEAQKVFATFSQEKVDAIVAAMAAAALAEKDRLGKLAHEETGYGIPADKAEKNRFAAEDVHNFFRNLKTVGVINETDTLIEIADPRGVVAAIIPSTNPTSTAIFKILISLKSRNGVVLSPHPSANQCINETTRVMRAAAEAAGAPSGLIGCMSVPTLQGTEELMKHKLTSVILATGGTGLVRAAYSSGKPAFGVGPGNVPVLIEASADIPKAVADVIAGKTFDYGTICASEQAIVCEQAIDKRVRAELLSQGAYFCSPQEKALLEKIVVTPTRGLNPQIVGKAPQVIAEMAGFKIPADVRLLIVEMDGVGREHPLSMEKLSPILAYYTAENWQLGSELCHQILRYGGMGHTIGIHSQNREIIRQFGLRQPASRIIVNSPTTHGAIGFSTDLPPSMTLGCGSWGGNVTSDNVSPLHLMDIKRIAFETRPVTRSRPLPISTVSAVARAAVAATGVKEVKVASAQKNHTETEHLSEAEISRLVEAFLAERKARRHQPVEPVHQTPAQPPQQQPPPPPAQPEVKTEQKTEQKQQAPEQKPEPVAFVCEEDVKRAIRDKQKIYVNAKTIITPSARELGEANRVFNIIASPALNRD
ncbi:MAG: aldehyde dehydrogenase family protein [Acidobacteriota bacterium]|nr:aldehyde dehydrogenase family protein [Blastocatellia bacterium]MDW8413221.1 aldehyde dehydrogenase family protein [Acidobacteriota bacterium]